MPVVVNVGLNRKASRDYQSTGLSINLSAELDSGLITAQRPLGRLAQNPHKDVSSRVHPGPSGSNLAIHQAHKIATSVANATPCKPWTLAAKQRPPASGDARGRKSG